MPSFERALAAGAQAIELDVQLTKDLRAVVMHDEDLARVTGGRDRRRVIDLTLAEVMALDLECALPGRSSPPLVGRAPTLATALELIASFGCRVAVEIKWEAGDPTPIVEAVAHDVRAVPASRASIISFSRGVVRMVQKRRVVEHYGWIRSRPLDAEREEFLREIDPPMLVLKKTLASPQFLGAVARPGREIWVYAVNDRAEVEPFLEEPVDGFISDDPAELVRLRHGGLL